MAHEGFHKDPTALSEFTNGDIIVQKSGSTDQTVQNSPEIVVH
jgi:hypothetical protein